MYSAIKMPQLEGTEAQIKWASKIRAEWLNQLQRECKMAAITVSKKARSPEWLELFKEEILAFYEEIASRTQAHSIIDLKFINYGECAFHAIDKIWQQRKNGSKM